MSGDADDSDTAISQMPTTGLGTRSECQDASDISVERKEAGPSKMDTSSEGGTSDEDARNVSPPTQIKRPGLAKRLWKWQPASVRYDQENPPKFTLLMNLVFSFVRARCYPTPSSTLLHPQDAL
jgi:hypothetical protein